LAAWLRPDPLWSFSAAGPRAAIVEGVVLLRGRPEEGRGERRGGRMDGDRTEERDKDGRERGICLLLAMGLGVCNFSELKF